MELVYRQARHSDLEKLVGMLYSDPLGKTREDNTAPLNKGYIEAFKEIERDPNNELIVAEKDGNIVGMLQLTFIPYLTYIGSFRCLIEGVRVDKNHRKQGIGKAMFKWAIERARERKCLLVQLTSDKARPEALKFYRDLGFVSSHEGFKMKLLK